MTRAQYDTNDVISRSKTTEILLKQYRLTKSVLRRIMTQLPSVDAVEVVRCEECMYNYKNNGHSKTGCPIVSKELWLGEDGFCSTGRREKDLKE